MHARVEGELGVAKLASERSHVLEVDVIDTLVEQKREDVAAELRVVDAAAEKVRGLLEEIVELGLRQSALGTGPERAIAVPLLSATGFDYRARLEGTSYVLSLLAPDPLNIDWAAAHHGPSPALAQAHDSK